MSDARLLLTCGLPGAGKTTLAMRLAADRRALRLTQDEWLIALGSSPWDVSTREKVDHELWRRLQARNFETPWNSYPIGRADFDEWLRIFQAPDAAELALFDPPPDSN